MKVLTKIAVCGMLSLTLNTAANAQAAAVSQKTVQAMQQSAAAKQYLQRFGIRAGATADDVNAALARLGSTERAAALSAINAFSSKAIISNDSAAISANDALAKKIFGSSNNQVIDLAKAINTTGSRDAVVAGEKMVCSSALDPAKMVAGTRFDSPTGQSIASNIILKGAIKPGHCDKNPEDLSAEARQNLLEIGEGKVKGLSEVEAIQAAFADDGVIYSAAEAAQKGKKLRADCGYL